MLAAQQVFKITYIVPCLQVLNKVLKLLKKKLLVQHLAVWRKIPCVRRIQLIDFRSDQSHQAAVTNHLVIELHVKDESDYILKPRIRTSTAFQCSALMFARLPGATKNFNWASKFSTAVARLGNELRWLLHLNLPPTLFVNTFKIKKYHNAIVAKIATMFEIRSFVDHKLAVFTYFKHNFSLCTSQRCNQQKLSVTAAVFGFCFLLLIYSVSSAQSRSWFVMLRQQNSPISRPRNLSCFVRFHQIFTDFAIT